MHENPFALPEVHKEEEKFSFEADTCDMFG